MVLILTGASTVQAQLQFANTTFLPFDGQQAMTLSGSSGEIFIYPNGKTYLQVTYQQELGGGERDLVIKKLNSEGKEQWKQVYERPGQDHLGDPAYPGKRICTRYPQSTGQPENSADHAVWRQWGSSLATGSAFRANYSCGQY